jgi:hypothetical protein
MTGPIRHHWLRHSQRAIATGVVIVLLGALAAPAAFGQEEFEATGDDEGVVASEQPSPWNDPGAVILDTMLIRPLGVVWTGVGFGFFLVSAPLVAPSGGTGESWDTFVYHPADSTFRRRLGDL